MPFIMNALDKKVAVRAYGQWFEFAPGAVKSIHNPAIAFKMATDLAYEGLVEVPDEVIENPTAPESVQKRAELKTQGIRNRITALKKIINNLEVSLKKDLDMANLKMDPRTLASDGEIEAYKELATLAKFEREQELDRVKVIEELTEKINGATAFKSDVRTPDSGYQNNSESTPRRK